MTSTVYCDGNDDGARSVYTLRCARTGESDDVVVCMRHAEHMPLIDDDVVTARPADAGIACDFRATSLRNSVVPCSECGASTFAISRRCMDCRANGRSR